MCIRDRSLVIYFSEEKSSGRCKKSRHASVFCFQHKRKIRRFSLTCPHFDQCTGKNSCHMIHESRSIISNAHFISCPHYLDTVNPSYCCLLYTSRSSVCSGHPSVENGHSADENQVSSVSSSCVMCVHPHFGHTDGFSLATTISPHSSQ